MPRKPSQGPSIQCTKYCVNTDKNIVHVPKRLQSKKGERQQI